MTLYLYALLDAAPPRTPAGLAAIRVGRTWAVVTEKVAPPPSERAILAHDRIVRQLAKTARAILPVRFATTVANKAALSALLAPHAERLAEAFERVREAVQFTLHVKGTKARVTIPRNVGPGTQWIAKRLARERAPEIEPINVATKPFVRATRVARRDAKDDLARVYHLVPKENVRAWRRALAEGEAKLTGKTSIKTTGPWPPYAFAELG